VYRFLEAVVAGNMTAAVKAVTPETTVRTLQGMFAKDDFNAYPVLQDEKLIGVVSKFDVLRCFSLTQASLVPRYDDLMNKTVADVMTHDFVAVGLDTALQRVLQLMVIHRIRSMPVVNSENRLIGIISREDVLRALDRSTAGDG
jgi:CBS domain-containing protein